jgi:hypothetical protein
MICDEGGSRATWRISQQLSCVETLYPTGELMEIHTYKPGSNETYVVHLGIARLVV